MRRSEGFLAALTVDVSTDYVLSFRLVIGEKAVMSDRIKYDIFRSDTAKSLVRVQAVEGLEEATNRIEELAANDPTSDYFLYSAEVGKVIRRLQRKSPGADSLPNEDSRKKAG
jgi:formate dehydrogenase maturation protein FdhE